MGIVQDAIGFFKIPGDAYSGKYVVAPQTPGTISESDVLRQDSATAQEKLDAFRLSGWGLAPKGGSFLSNLIPESFPGTAAKANTMASPLDGAIGLDTTFSQRFGSWPSTVQLPSTFAPSSTTPGNIVTSKGGAADSVSIPGTLAVQGTNGQPNNPTVAANIGAAIDNYFVRGAAVVLGLVFVAVGLHMFRPDIIPNPVRR